MKRLVRALSFPVKGDGLLMGAPFRYVVVGAAVVLIIAGVGLGIDTGLVDTGIGAGMEVGSVNGAGVVTMFGMLVVTGGKISVKGSSGSGESTCLGEGSGVEVREGLWDPCLDRG